MDSTEQLIRQHEVVQISGISKSEVRRRVLNHTFPAPIKLGDRCTRWSLTEVQEWVRDRLAERQSDRAAA